MTTVTIRRYTVVLQADELTAPSMWVVAPTSTSAPPRTFRPEIEIDGVTTRVFVDQMTAVDHFARLGEFTGRLSAAELRDVGRATSKVLGIA